MFVPSKVTPILITLLSVVAFIALTVITGWYLQESLLIQISSSFVPMQFNTAICFLLAAIATIFLILQKKTLSISLAIILIVLAGLTGFQYIIGQNLGIDQLFMEAYLLVHSPNPGRMGLSTSICFVLIGISVIAENRTINLGIIKHLVMIVIAIALLSFIGYLGNINTAYVWGNMSGMAVHTAFNFIILGLVIFLVQVQHNKNIEHNKPWHIAPIVTSSLILFLGFWQSLESFQIQLMSKQIQKSTEAVTKSIELGFNIQNAEIEQFAILFKENIHNPKTVLTDNMANYFNSHNAVLSINWLDEDNQLQWSITRDERSIATNTQSTIQSLVTPSIKEIKSEQEPFIVWGNMMNNSVATYQVLYPLFELDKYYGAFQVTFLTNTLIPAYLTESDIFATHLISLDTDEGNVFRSFALDTLLEAKKHAAFNTISHEQSFSMLGQQLTLKLQPSVEFMEDNLSPIPKFILVIGVLMSFLIAYALIMRVKERQAYQLSEANQQKIISIQKQAIIKHEKLEKTLTRSNEELAEIDQLTGLENRYMFDRNLKKMFQQHSVVSGGFALLLLDLDHFKTINDTLGHSVGDELLTAAALRIKNNIRQECKVYRLGGDEFGIISTLKNKHEIEQLVPRLMNTLNTPYALTDMNIECTSSIGIAIYPDDATSAESLYKHADMALYIAKDEGRDRCQFYNEDIQHRFLRKIYIEDAVKKSLKNKYFSVFYQPVISQLQSKLVGAEALLRWGPEQHFQISIPETIKVAEDTGLIIQIGYQVFELVCRQLSLWRSTNTVDDDFAISVNLSPAQLKCVDILERFNRIATKYDVLPKHIKLEITESLQLDDEKTNSILTDLSNAGYKIVLDDFGTGYASIAQLCNPIFSTIKIDKSIIDTIATDDEKLFYAVSKMLNTLNLPIIAEGIETQSQLDACFGVNIDMIQGYFYSKPTTAEVFEQRWLTH